MSCYEFPLKPNLSLEWSADNLVIQYAVNYKWNRWAKLFFLSIQHVSNMFSGMAFKKCFEGLWMENSS